jgi:predicted amidophosphoribosyltransferase
MIVPLPDLIAAAVLLAILALVVRRLFRGRKKTYVQCPGCQKFLQPGRRHCPYCKQELVKY